MTYHLLADAVLLIHLAFILFVVLGALVVRRFPRLVWPHLIAVTWGGVIEITGHVCPLTPLEDLLRRLGGEAGYSGGFVGHYLTPVIYPHELDRPVQIGFGVGVIVINVAAYLLMYCRAKRHKRKH